MLNRTRSGWLWPWLALFILVGCRETVPGNAPTLEVSLEQPVPQATAELPPTFTPQAMIPTETTQVGNNLVCQEDSECVLVVRIDSCCSCPEIMNRSALITNEALVLYEPGLSYGELLPDACASVACETCLPPPVPVCSADGLCRAQGSVETILQECPDCYEQAAVAAFQNGATQDAINYCYQVDANACLLTLFNIAFVEGDIERGIQLCFDPAHPDPGGCLATFAPSIALEDSDRAVSLCQQIVASDVRRFGCLLDVASAVYGINQEQGRAICQQLEGERIEQCLAELGS